MSKFEEGLILGSLYGGQSHSHNTTVKVQLPDRTPTDQLKDLKELEDAFLAKFIHNLHLSNNAFNVSFHLMMDGFHPTVVVAFDLNSTRRVLKVERTPFMASIEDYLKEIVNRISNEIAIEVIEPLVKDQQVMASLERTLK